MTFKEKLHQGIVLFDGAMGTQIQVLKPSPQEWDGKFGCSEVLNITAPEKIQQIHESYLSAGADVIETNTFGANEIVLAEYQLQDQTIEINKLAAQIARRAVEKVIDSKPRFVAGAIGPGTKLISLGQTDFDMMYQSYSKQAQGLIEGGVDLFIIETCQDLLQIKTALLAISDTMRNYDLTLPILVSVTIETTGTLLLGSEIGAVLTVLEPFEIDALGLNCATGPEHMRPYIKQICQQFNGPVICQPNAGLPQNINGEMVYTLSPKDFADVLSQFVKEMGVQIIGGCCGTTPAFIQELANRVSTLKRAERKIEQNPALASLFSVQKLQQDIKPFFVGERANTNGSKKFREYLLNDDWHGIVEVAKQQQKTGAHGLDLCVAYTGRHEVSDMTEAVKRIAQQVELPLFIDSTDIRVLETALKLYGGRAVLNSVNLEDGEDRVNRVCQLAKRYGAAMIALMIDENGMALTVDQKMSIAKRIYNIAIKNGLRPQDLIFDALTFTLGSGDESLKDSAANTLNGIRAIKKAFPGIYTILGISNVSFGLSPHSREILNSVFLAEAVKAGLDLAIVNVQKIIPLYKINKNDRQHCLNLIYDRNSDNPLFDFIQHFDKQKNITSDVETEESKISLDEKIQQCIIHGSRSGLENLLTEKLLEMNAVGIINELLIPSMKKVGDLFGAGEMQLPFVLQSAEVMNFAVDKLKPFMQKTDSQQQTSIVLATVRGDVHDIGKNLVDIILSNNGYKVYNLGNKCEIERIIQKAEEVKANAIGMSGLLVKSTVVMKENLEVIKSRNLKIPVLLGGAALNKNYVDEVCKPILDVPIFYCRDAFDGLRAMESIKNNELDSSSPELNSIRYSSNKQFPSIIKKEKIETLINFTIPVPPFLGDKLITEINLDEVFACLNEKALFRGRWGYRQEKMNDDEYESLLDREVRPIFDMLKARCKAEQLLNPKLVYGYYQCNCEGDQIIVYKPNSDEEWLRFTFPRQQRPPFRCIADFFLPVDSGQKDIIAFQVVTIGEQAAQEVDRLFKSDQYKNYLMFHGLSVETAEALAEYWHQKIRQELQIRAENGERIEDFIVQKHRGLRYSFGYPACPDLAENRKIFEILRPERIGVTLTDEDQMVPEQTTSAFMVHHPKAKYFSIK